jgi:transmembrane sensor
MSYEPRQFVEPTVSEARVERLWGNVSTGLKSAPSRGFAPRWALLGMALVGAASAAFFVHGRLATPAASSEPSARAVLADVKLETASDALAVTLNDGSSVQLASRSRVQVHGNQSSYVTLSLAQGEVVCDVTHREGRKFSVVAGDVEVRVVGTKFSVKTTPGVAPRVEVNVLRGVVEVVSKRRPGIMARVAAGQTWIQNSEAVSPEPASLPSAASQSDVAVTPRVDDAPVAAASAASAPASAPAVASARELFEKAGQSRRDGDAAGAARAYEELLRLHPADGRASLSAFELGRLRMDRLADPRGAVTALERAVALNLGPSFREDALARLVSVYASQANFAACARARDRYLASYPAGVHAGAVRARCGSH